MPLDRFLHSVAGHSVKVSSLTHLEYRVWTQYLLSADDFGIMRATPIQFQSDNTALLKVPTRTIQKAIDRLLELGLVQTFTNQGQAFFYQRDWQNWQKVGFPRTTKLPLPSDDEQATCTDETQDLFTRWPGGKKRKDAEPVAEDSGNGSEKVPVAAPEVVGQFSRARMTQAMAPAHGYGYGKGKGAMGGSYASQSQIVFSHRGHTMTRNAHYDAFVDRFNGDASKAGEWLTSEIDAAYLEGKRPGSIWKFIDERWEKKPTNSLSTSKTAGNIAALQDFVKAGNR